MAVSVRIAACCLAVILTAVVAVSATFSEDLLRVPLFDVPRLWVNASGTVLTRLQTFIFTVPDFSSPWTYLKLTIISVVLYYLYIIFLVPMSRVRKLGDLGYVSEGNKFSNMKEIAEAVKQRRRVGEVPPVYPNGWFGILESRELGVTKVRSISVLGRYLICFCRATN